MFKVGDTVRVKMNISNASIKYNGKIGRVIQVYPTCVSIDIDKEEGGLWNDEVSLINIFYTNLLRKTYAIQKK